MKLYGVYDKVACDYIGFFSAKNDEVAIRGLKSLEKNDPRCSTDFSLVCLGALACKDIYVEVRDLGTIVDLVGGADNE